ncbi:unnamed protein product [Arabidopsis lyrata]|nr:unnamed protein product [Arabidopsis lyrata]
MPFGFRHFSLSPSDLVSTRSKRAEEAAAFFASQSAVVFRKTKKAKAVHNSVAVESRCRITIPDSSNSETTGTIGEGTTPVDVSYSQAEFENGETSVAGVLSSSQDADKFGKPDEQVLPKRFFSTDRYPTRGRVNSYSKPHYLVDILSVLDGTQELVTLKSSPFSSLFELPVRRCSLSDAKHYWYTLLGSEEEYTIEHIVNMLKAKPAMPGWKKIRLSLIVIVEGVLICGTQPIHASLPTVEMVRNLDTFFSYPWGRHAFDHTLRMFKVGEKVRNHNILINKLKQKTLVIHGFPIAIQLMLFQSIPLLLRYLPSSDDAQTFYDMSLSVLPTLKTYHTNNILLVKNDKDLIVSQSVVSTKEDCVSVGGPKVSHMLSLIRRGYRFSKGDWRVGDASLGKLCSCDKKKNCRCNCGPDSSPPNTCTPARVPGHLPANADSKAIAKLTAKVAHLKNTYAELYVKLKADVVVELKSFLEAHTLKHVSSSKPLEEEENVALPSEVKTGKPKAFSSDTGHVYGCVENCSKDVTVNPERRLQSVDPSFQPSVREDDVLSNLQLALPFLPSTLEMHPASVTSLGAASSLRHCHNHTFQSLVEDSIETLSSKCCGLDECNDPRLAHHVSLPSDPASAKEILGTDLISEVPNQLVTAHATGGLCPGHPEHMDLILWTIWRKRGSYLAAKGIILLDSLFTQLLCSQYSNFVNAAAPSAFLWDPLVASYIEGTGGDRTERTTWFKDVNTVYVPMNWGNRHWVGLVICLKSSHIDILDPYVDCSSDNEVATYMELLVTMLPRLLNTSCDPTDIGVLLDSPFSYHRVEGLPQNTRTGDCGPFVMKLIEMHSHDFSVEDMGHIPDAKVDIFRMDYAIHVYEEFIGKVGL